MISFNVLILEVFLIFREGTRIPRTTRSRYGSPFATSSTLNGTPFMERISSLIGMEEMMMSAGSKNSWPSNSQRTPLMTLFSVSIPVTLQRKRILPPLSVNFLAAKSQSCPGPNLGYKNSSPNSASSCAFGFFLFDDLSLRMEETESPFRRWAPHSALIWDG